LKILRIFFRTKGKNMSVCYSVISTFITKSLLTFFRELHILTVRKLVFPFFEPNLFPLLEGGRLIFYTFVRIGENRFFQCNHIKTEPSANHAANCSIIYNAYKLIGIDGSCAL